VRILVADDDPVSLRLMEHMLRNSGYKVITADNGQEAARILSKADGPRMALIDWMMPGLDGPSVCRAVRGRHEDAYVYMVLLTSKQSSADVVQGLEAGADDYLIKPCHPAELKARLHTGRRVLQLEDRLVEAREKMRFKATHDSLTSLWDRGAIIALLHSEQSRTRREHSPVSILLCDVDHFKKVNDVYGHAVGDEVLAEVSKRIKDSVRSHDAVGRYGGEEFLIVMGGTGSEEVKERAEQVRSAVSCLPFSTAQGLINVSLSMGVTTIEDWDRALPADLFLKEADDALYRAKESGRDKVVFGQSILERTIAVVNGISEMPDRQLQ
jgi:two-component system, cell cycle response regulator